MTSQCRSSSRSSGGRSSFSFLALHPWGFSSTGRDINIPYPLACVTQVHSIGITRSGPCSQLKGESELGTRAGGSLMVRGLVPLILGMVLASSATCGGNPSEDTCGPINSQCANLATDTCGKCMSSCCCQQMIACFNNPSCASLSTCVEECNLSDPACVSNCAMSSPGGQSLLMNSSTCGNSNCSSACQ
jgi:hypothetical protein